MTFRRLTREQLWQNTTGESVERAVVAQESGVSGGESFKEVAQHGRVVGGAKALDQSRD